MHNEEKEEWAPSVDVLNHVKRCVFIFMDWLLDHCVDHGVCSFVNCRVVVPVRHFPTIVAIRLTLRRLMIHHTSTWSFFCVNVLKILDSLMYFQTMSHKYMIQITGLLSNTFSPMRGLRQVGPSSLYRCIIYGVALTRA